jgi:hypothetical protein
MIRPCSLSLTLLVAVAGAIAATAVETGFQADVKVQKPTRLGWEFVAQTFGAEAV